MKAMPIIVSHAVIPLTHTHGCMVVVTEYDHALTTCVYIHAKTTDAVLACIPRSTHPYTESLLETSRPINASVSDAT